MDFHLHQDILWIDRPDGSARLLHLGGNICAIDAQSADLLRSILERGVDWASSDLASRGRGDPREARADVGAFVAELRKQRILRRGRASERETFGHRVSVAVMVVALKAIDSPKHSLERRARRLLLAARWAVPLFGWRNAHAAWDTAFPQPGTGGVEHGVLMESIDKAVRDAAAHSLLKFECKERALACVALGRSAGVHAKLVLGVAFMPMRAHVWVEAGNRVFSDDADHCRDFERVSFRSGLVPSAR